MPLLLVLGNNCPFPFAADFGRFSSSMLAVYVLDDLGHLDEHAFVFGNGVKENNCSPLSTIHDPVRHETRGEGETIRSASGKLLLLRTKL